MSASNLRTALAADPEPGAGNLLPQRRPGQVRTFLMRERLLASTLLASTGAPAAEGSGC